MQLIDDFHYSIWLKQYTLYISIGLIILCILTFFYFKPTRSGFIVLKGNIFNMALLMIGTFFPEEVERHVMPAMDY